jgi:hypothetical protein
MLLRGHERGREGHEQLCPQPRLLSGSAAAVVSSLLAADPEPRSHRFHPQRDLMLRARGVSTEGMASSAVASEPIYRFSAARRRLCAGHGEHHQVHGQAEALPAIGTGIRFQLGPPHVQNHSSKPPRGYMTSIA